MRFLTRGLGGLLKIKISGDIHQEMYNAHPTHEDHDRRNLGKDLAFPLRCIFLVLLEIFI